MKRIVILLSGRGSNMKTLVASALARGDSEIAGIIANRADSQGLEWAKAQGYPAFLLSHKDFESREAFDAELLKLVSSCEPDLVLLAGFMRVLTDVFVERFRGRLVNIHPSVLPAFPGLNTHQRVLDEGALVHGCTVHFVIPALDAGPAICQALVPVLPNDNAETLSARTLEVEHQIFVIAMGYLLDGYCRMNGDTVEWTHQMPRLFLHPMLEQSGVTKTLDGTVS